LGQRQIGKELHTSASYCATATDNCQWRFEIRDLVRPSCLTDDATGLRTVAYSIHRDELAERRAINAHMSLRDANFTDAKAKHTAATRPT
jgi:hypothetical protein